MERTSNERGGMTLDIDGGDVAVLAKAAAYMRGTRHAFDEGDEQDFDGAGEDDDEPPASPEDLFTAAHTQEQARLALSRAKAAAKAAKDTLEFETWRLRQVYRNLAKQRGIDPDAREAR